MDLTPARLFFWKEVITERETRKRRRCSRQLHGRHLNTNCDEAAFSYDFETNNSMRRRERSLRDTEIRVYHRVGRSRQHILRILTKTEVATDLTLQKRNHFHQGMLEDHDMDTAAIMAGAIVY